MQTSKWIEQMSDESRSCGRFVVLETTVVGVLRLFLLLFLFLMRMIAM